MKIKDRIRDKIYVSQWGVDVSLIIHYNDYDYDYLDYDSSKNYRSFVPKEIGK